MTGAVGALGYIKAQGPISTVNGGLFGGVGVNNGTINNNNFAPKLGDTAPAPAPAPSALSAGAPATSAPSTPKPVYGALYKWQIDILANSVAQYPKIVIARPKMTAPQNFAISFEIVFRTLGIEPLQDEQNPNARDQTGVRIGVVDINKPPSADALRMQDVIRKMGFEGDFIQLRDQPLKDAEANNGFAIYIGPPPLN